MKNEPSKKDIMRLTIGKVLASVPKFESEEEFLEFLRKDAERPRAERITEGHQLMEQAKQELSNVTYLY